MAPPRAPEKDWRVRELPTAEFYRLRTVPPYTQLPEGVLPDARARIIVVERKNSDGSWRIVRHWAAFNAVHVEPLWAEPAERGNPATAKALMREMKAILDDDGVIDAFAIIADADAGDMLPLARRAGFTLLPGRLYAVHRKITRD